MSKPYYSENMPESLSDILIFELDQRWSRESKELAPTALALPLGSVLGIGADGLLVPYHTELTPEAGDNPATYADAAFVLLQSLPASSTAQNALVLARCARVRGLHYVPEVTDELKAQAVASLASRDILVGD